MSLHLAIEVQRSSIYIYLRSCLVWFEPGHLQAFLTALGFCLENFSPKIKTVCSKLPSLKVIVGHQTISCRFATHWMKFLVPGPDQTAVWPCRMLLGSELFLSQASQSRYTSVDQPCSASDLKKKKTSVGKKKGKPLLLNRKIGRSSSALAKFVTSKRKK